MLVNYQQPILESALDLLRDAKRQRRAWLIPAGLLLISYLAGGKHGIDEMWFYGLVFCNIFVAGYIGSKTNLLCGVCFFLVNLSGLWVFQYPETFYRGLIVNFFQREIHIQKDISMYAYRFAAATSFAFTLVCVAVASMKQKTLIALENGFMYLCFLNALWIIWEYLNGVPPLERGIMYGNASINSTFIAFTYPLLFKTKNNWFNNYPFIWVFALAVTLLSIFLSGSSVAVGVLAVISFAAIYLASEKSHRKFALMVPGIVLAIGAAFLGTKDLLDSNSRFIFYKMMWNNFRENANQWIGLGNGTHSTWAMKVQSENNWNVYFTNNRLTGDIWDKMHSDILQTVVSNGYIISGLILIMVIQAGFSCLKSKRYSILFCLCGYVAACAFNYPLHLPVHAIFGAFLIRASFNKNDLLC